MFKPTCSSSKISFTPSFFFLPCELATCQKILKNVQLHNASKQNPHGDCCRENNHTTSTISNSNNQVTVASIQISQTTDQHLLLCPRVSHLPCSSQFSLSFHSSSAKFKYHKPLSHSSASSAGSCRALHPSTSIATSGELAGIRRAYVPA